MCIVWSVFLGVNYKYDETLVVPIIENTPEEHELKVSLIRSILLIANSWMCEHEDSIDQALGKSTKDQQLFGLIPKHDVC